MADAVLIPEDSSGHVSTLARDWAMRVDTAYGTTAQETPAWIFVYGLSKVNPTTDLTLQDDGDIHAGGRKSQLSTAIGGNIEVEGLRKGRKTGDVVVPDPGLEYLRLKGQTVGYENIVKVWVYRTDGLPESHTGFYVVNWTDTGGDKEGLQAFTCALTGRGKRTNVTKPTATVTP